MNLPAIAPATSLPSTVSTSAAPTANENFGLLSPGVRLMRNLQFRAKALLIGLMFAVPIAWLGVSFWQSEMAVIDFAEQELNGVAYNRAIFPLVEAAQQLRRDTVALATTGTAPASLADVRSKVAALQGKLAEVEKSYGAQLGTSELYAAVQAAFAKAESTKGSPAEIFDARSAYVDALLALLLQATDGSNLTLDPDIDSYYLMDAAYFRIPDIMENTGYIRGKGRAAQMEGRMAPEVQSSLLERIVIIEFQFRNMRDGLAKSYKATPELRSSVDSSAALKATEDLVKFARAKLIVEPDFSQAAQEKLVNDATQTIASQLKLAQALEDSLERLLHQRIAGKQRSLIVSSVLSGVFVLLAIYAFICFYRATQSGLGLIGRHLGEMAEGDLRHKPARPPGRDEPVVLIEGLSRTYTSMHELIRKVRHGARELQIASNEIATASSDLSARTEAAAATLEEQSSVMEQIGATVQATAEQASSAAAFATDNAVVAEKGGEVIAQLVSTMREIHASSSKIHDIIGVIDGIAFQTNILALNAAVEAARAGEAGRGFAVVASEVRALAQRSAEAAKEIKTLISASVETVQGGTQVVEGAGASMGTVVTNAKQISFYLGEIANAAKEQAKGIAQVVEAIQDLDQSTQQNAALGEETNSAAMTMKSQAQILQDQIARFRVA